MQECKPRRKGFFNRRAGLWGERKVNDEKNALALTPPFPQSNRLEVRPLVSPAPARHQRVHSPAFQLCHAVTRAAGVCGEANGRSKRDRSAHPALFIPPSSRPPSPPSPHSPPLAFTGLKRPSSSMRASLRAPAPRARAPRRAMPARCVLWVWSRKKGWWDGAGPASQRDRHPRPLAVHCATPVGGG